MDVNSGANEQVSTKCYYADSDKNQWKCKIFWSGRKVAYSEVWTVRGIGVGDR